MNIFNWSMPFVAEKITEIFYNILNKEEILDDNNDNDIDVKELMKKNDKLVKLKKNKGIMKNKL